MAIRSKTMRVAYRYIKYIDGWMGHKLEEDQFMIIRKVSHNYRVDMYDKDTLVDTRFALDNRYANDECIGFMLDIIFIWICMLAGWIISTPYHTYKPRQDGEN
jgi:hypothetical protein